MLVKILPIAYTLVVSHSYCRTSKQLKLSSSTVGKPTWPFLALLIPILTFLVGEAIMRSHLSSIGLA